MATMLAAMNSDLTRFIILERAVLPFDPSARGDRAFGSWPAAWAARRAAAMKLDLLPVAAAAGRTPAKLASEATMRAPAARGGPDPGSSGWSAGAFVTTGARLAAGG